MKDVTVGKSNAVQKEFFYLKKNNEETGCQLQIFISFT